MNKNLNIHFQKEVSNVKTILCRIFILIYVAMFSKFGTAQSLLKNPSFKNAHVGIAIYNTNDKKYIVDYQGEKYFVPASNTKLLTCYAAMKYLGDSIKGIQYQILDDSTVAIIGMGDPTFLHPDFENQPVFDFLRNFRKIYYFRSGFEDFLGNGWSWNDYMATYMAPRSNMPLYGNIVKIERKEHEVQTEPQYFTHNIKLQNRLKGNRDVIRDMDHNTFFVSRQRRFSKSVPFIPHEGTIMNLLADTLQSTVWPMEDELSGSDFIYSQPLDSMLSIMMHRSDNFFAEQSLLMVGQKEIGSMKDKDIIDLLLETDFADMPQEPSWVDGSGLSRYNLLSPKDFVFVLNKMEKEFGMERMKTILPGSGVGTLSGLYGDIPGSIYAKTGTLNGVISLSGYLITRKKQLLIFSILVNNHRTYSGNIRKGIESYLKEIWRKY